MEPSDRYHSFRDDLYQWLVTALAVGFWIGWVPFLMLIRYMGVPADAAYILAMLFCGFCGIAAMYLNLRDTFK